MNYKLISDFLTGCVWFCVLVFWKWDAANINFEIDIYFALIAGVNCASFESTVKVFKIVIEIVIISFLMLTRPMHAFILEKIILITRMMKIATIVG